MEYFVGVIYYIPLCKIPQYYMILYMHCDCKDKYFKRNNYMYLKAYTV